MANENGMSRRTILGVALAPVGVLAAAASLGHVSSISNGKDDVFAEIEEVERHHHNRERWFGAAAVPSGEVHVADHDVMTPFVPDAGNDTWGSWLQLLGSSDTPHLTGMTQYDPHQIFISAVEQNSAIYRIQVGWGASGAAALSAEAFTEVLFLGPGAAFRSPPLPLLSKRQAAGTKIWTRIWADGANTATMNLFLGIHEYED